MDVELENRTCKSRVHVEAARTYTVAEHSASNLVYHIAEIIIDNPIWSYSDTDVTPKNYDATRICEIDNLIQAAMMQLTRRATGDCAITL